MSKLTESNSDSKAQYPRTEADAVAEIAKAAVTPMVVEPGKTIKKAGRGIQMIVSDNITTKIPKAEVDPSFFFFDEETGSLTRNDPYQPDLPLQSLPPRRGMNELKEA